MSNGKNYREAGGEDSYKQGTVVNTHIERSLRFSSTSTLSTKRTKNHPLAVSNQSIINAHAHIPVPSSNVLNNKNVSSLPHSSVSRKSSSSLPRISKAKHLNFSTPNTPIIRKSGSRMKSSLSEAHSLLDLTQSSIRPLERIRKVYQASSVITTSQSSPVMPSVPFTVPVSRCVRFSDPIEEHHFSTPHAVISSDITDNNLVPEGYGFDISKRPSPTVTGKSSQELSQSGCPSLPDLKETNYHAPIVESDIHAGFIPETLKMVTNRDSGSQSYPSSYKSQTWAVGKSSPQSAAADTTLIAPLNAFSSRVGPVEKSRSICPLSIADQCSVRSSETFNGFSEGNSPFFLERFMRCPSNTQPVRPNYGGTVLKNLTTELKLEDFPKYDPDKLETSQDYMNTLYHIQGATKTKRRYFHGFLLYVAEREEERENRAKAGDDTPLVRIKSWYEWKHMNCSPGVWKSRKGVDADRPCWYNDGVEMGVKEYVEDKDEQGPIVVGDLDNKNEATPRTGTSPFCPGLSRCGLPNFLRLPDWLFSAFEIAPWVREVDPLGWDTLRMVLRARVFNWMQDWGLFKTLYGLPYFGWVLFLFYFVVTIVSLILLVCP